MEDWRISSVRAAQAADSLSGCGPLDPPSGPPSQPTTSGQHLRELDRVVLQLRLERGLTIAQIADSLGLEREVAGASLLRGMHRVHARPEQAPRPGLPEDVRGSQEAASVSLVGRTLSRYRLLERIGRGGMGVVYRAFDQVLEREVALKVLPPDRARDPRWRRGLLQEARTGASLAGSHSCVIHDVAEEDGVLFIAMELIRGVRLLDVLRGEGDDSGEERSTSVALPTARALDLAVEIGEALAQAHEQGIVHLDLKPANVMVTESGHAKLIDFGLARPAEAAGDVEAGAGTLSMERPPRRVCGTLSYMSPEQVCGEPVDGRSDIFTFGILLHEMLVGVNPFRRATQAETRDAILHAPVPPVPLSLVGDLGFRLRCVLSRCLARAPGRRYQDMRDLLPDLRELRRPARTEKGRYRRLLRAPGHALIAGLGSVLCALCSPAGV